MPTEQELQEMKDIQSDFFRNVMQIKYELDTFRKVLDKCYKKTTSNDLKQNLLKINKEFEHSFGRGSFIESSLENYTEFFNCDLNKPINQEYKLYRRFLNGIELNNDLKHFANKLERINISSNIILKNQASLSNVNFFQAIGKTISRIAKKIVLKSYKDKSWFKYKSPAKIVDEYDNLERNNQEALFLAKEKTNPLGNPRYIQLIKLDR